MHLILAAYLFIGGAYSAWAIRHTKKKFVKFSDYFKFVAIATFLWVLLLAKDLIVALYEAVFSTDQEN